MWFLVAYSLDLNPIEEGCSKVDAHLRKAAARTQEAFAQATGKALSSVMPL